ncbi:MAG TPA: OmpA family protein, partial [Planctomycetota bacterium]|nr:OmpA family protein [Planctomycetota bacterium]
MTPLDTLDPATVAEVSPVTTACSALANPVVLDRFAHDSAALTPDHHRILIAVARCILARRRTRTPANNLDIVGFASTTGSMDYNLELGRRRAQAVRTELRRTLERMLPGSSSGIVMNASSQGETNQVAGGAAANRRVAIFLPA